MLLNASDALAVQAVEHGCAASLCALLDSEAASVRSAAAAACEALAATPAGAGALRVSPRVEALAKLVGGEDGAAKDCAIRASALIFP